MKAFALTKLVVLGALMPSVHSGTAQSCTGPWFKIAGGGGTSTGGVYSVSGIIGRPTRAGH